MKTAMILAAGLGTRLQPITNTKPKALVEFQKIPMIVHTINKLVSFGYEKIVVNVHHHREILIDFLKMNDFGVEIVISDEKEDHLQTGGGIKNAKHLFESDNILVHNVDIISSLEIDKLEEFHLKMNNEITLAIRKKNDNRVLLFDENLNLAGWKDKVKQIKIISKNSSILEEFGFTGIYMISQRLIEKFPSERKFDIIQFLLKYSEMNRVSGFIDNSQFWFDLGSEKQINEAENYFENIK